MDNVKILKKDFYNEYLNGISFVSGNEVLILGEQTVLLEDNRTVEQYIYNIKGYKCENGKPFVTLKGNIVIVS